MRDASVQQQFLSALESGSLARIRDLIDAGADVNLPTNDPDGETPLIRAISAGDLSAVQVLIAAGADVNLSQKGGRSWTPLMFAHDKPSITRELISAGARVNATLATQVQTVDFRPQSPFFSSNDRPPTRGLWTPPKAPFDLVDEKRSLKSSLPAIKRSQCSGIQTRNR